ncbi:MAG TPA: DUF3667 domain-containing protein [Henriciella marina]|uniref:DUF3667 domain-containing protein n=1 Tax=Henriciella sp. TaxID=1968823 RepID=UPI0017E31A16|nr:DUF3667 domain-containing protein [Henriciella sp.]HIG23664.1 DUF3667 domain-containing protein [Henriciella sp.]HIK64815.1 DUF3667 domain-containing protein [Henriciella marina]
MSDELEAAGLASVGALSAGGTADLQGQPCRNCGVMVKHRYCPNCGQLAASFHRPFYALIAETVSDSLALDGRIARTLPMLLFRPGKLSREYSEGRRARYVPPFRLFLLSSLIFYFVAFAFINTNGVNALSQIETGEGAELDAGERAAVLDYLAQNENFDEDELERVIENARASAAAEAEEGAASPEASEPVENTEDSSIDDESDEFGERLEGAVQRTIDNPRIFTTAAENWAPRLSLLLVPLTILALALMYAWRRSIYIYDNAIHALHLHSWIYLSSTLAFGLSALLGGWVAGLYYSLALPIYTMFSMRGAYGTGYVQAFLRMVTLSFFWLISLVVLLFALIVLSLLAV